MVQWVLAEGGGVLVVLVRGVGFAEINEPPDPANTPDLTPSRSRPPIQDRNDRWITWNNHISTAETTRKLKHISKSWIRNESKQEGYIHVSDLSVKNPTSSRYPGVFSPPSPQPASPGLCVIKQTAVKAWHFTNNAFRYYNEKTIDTGRRSDAGWRYYSRFLFFFFLDVITSLCLSKQSYFLVDCPMHFGTVPGLNLFRKTRGSASTNRLHVKFSIKLCHGYDFLFLKWILNAYRRVYIFCLLTRSRFLFLFGTSLLLASLASRFAAVMVPRFS